MKHQSLGPLCAALVMFGLMPDAAHAAATFALSVIDAGAVADGRTDDTAAFQKALNACGAQGGGIVEAPAGTYRIAGNLLIPPNVTLRGTFVSAPNGSAKDILAGQCGSALLASAGRGQPDAAPFITLGGTNAVLEGFAIYYPEWKETDVPPVPYPPTVACDPKKRPLDNDAVLNCLFLNSYDAIRLIHAGRHHIANVTGYPSHCGIYLDGIGDVGRIENVHFWPFGGPFPESSPYRQWINHHGVAFEIGFSDWQIIADSFSFGYSIGFKFEASPLPRHQVSCGKLIGCGADSCGLPLDFEAAYSHWQISDGEFVGAWGSTGTTAVKIGPDVRARIDFTNCAFWGPLARIITMQAPEGIVSLDNCQISTWDDDTGAIDIEAGRAILQGNSFDREGRRHLVVGPDAGPVVATGNLAEPFFDIEAAPGAQVLASANQTLDWPAHALDHYVVDAGLHGDAAFLDGWYSGEAGTDASGAVHGRRWSKAESLIQLPVEPDTPYDVTLRLEIPGGAVDADAGIYLGAQRLAAFAKAGPAVLHLSIPPQSSGRADLRVVAKTWEPPLTANGQDTRQLGVSLSSIEVKSARSADSGYFDIAQRKWLTTPPP